MFTAALVRHWLDNCVSLKVRVVIVADHPLDDIFVHNGEHGHDESHILMDDLGLKRVRAPFSHVGWGL